FASISAQSRSTVSSDMLFASLLDLAAKSLRQNDSELAGNAPGPVFWRAALRLPCHVLHHHPE
ncbi:MAG: hypothetical protein WC048_01680, partial [Rhizobium sp.]